MNYNISKIKKFLLSNPNYFCEDTDAITINEVIFFKMRNPKNIIFHEECMICDIYAHELWIVRVLKKKKMDKIRGKKLDIEALGKICDVYDKNGKAIFYRFNGYWKIPDV